MLRTTLIAIVAAALAMLSTAGNASAHRHWQNNYVGDNALLVDNQNDDENDDDVASVAEPVYYAPVQGNYVAYQTTQYVPVTDTIVTPYGYTPQDQNGYYQGYGYNNQYASNPYYAGATNGVADPVSTAVVSTVMQAAVGGGRIDTRNLITSLVTSYLAARAQQQYQPQYQQGYQQQPVYQQQPIYQQVIQRYAPVPVYVQQQQGVPQYAPVYVRQVRGEHGGGHHHGDGGGDHGDHGDNGDHGD